jgi:hypothetical protein
MAPIKPKKKPLTEREERILLSLKKLDFLNRSQLQEIHQLGGKRNANKTLARLNDYLLSWRLSNETIYYLGKKGRVYTQCNKVRRKTPKIEHYLMRNDFYIFAGQPDYWKNEMKMSDGTNTLICDACYKEGDTFHVLEVDYAQTMRDNKVKAQKYQSMFQKGIVEKKLGYFPIIVWYTTTEYRREVLKELSQGFPSVVYTTSDIK